jgi:hypothetical protein
MDKLIDLLIKAFEKTAAPLWDSLIFWRITALILVSSAAAAWFFRKRIIRRFTHEKYASHDRAKFAKADKILSEQFLYVVLSSLESTAGIARDDADPLLQFCAFFTLEQNKLLIPELRKAADETVLQLSRVNEFIAQHFFATQHPGQYRMYPDLKDQGGREDRERWSHFHDLLGNQTEAARQAYQTYRRAIKKILLT